MSTRRRLSRLFLAASLLAVSVSGVHGQGRSFTGTITDSECADANHSHMRMGDTDAECVRNCIDMHGASYVLFDGRTTYQLTDQKAAAPFAAKKVTVSGTLDEKTKTITVTSIADAK